MRYLILSLLCLSAAIPCHAQGTFQEMRSRAQQMLQQQQQGQQGQLQGQQMPGQTASMPSGTSSVQPGTYMMSNMETGQAFFVNVVPGGQMFAVDPRSVQVSFSPMGGGGMMQQQQSGNGLGGMIKGTLGNYLEKKLAPQQAPQGY